MEANQRGYQRGPGTSGVSSRVSDYNFNGSFKFIAALRTNSVIPVKINIVGSEVLNVAFTFIIHSPHKYWTGRLNGPAV